MVTDIRVSKVTKTGVGNKSDPQRVLNHWQYDPVLILNLGLLSLTQCRENIIVAKAQDSIL
jgi:hypothetical protein